MKSASFKPLFLLLALSFITRMVALQEPYQVVFDEVHWGKYITAYCCSHENFFDVHPPHGKLMVAGLAKFSGYTGNQDFSRIGLPYVTVNPIFLRVLPAFLGALIPAIAFLILLELAVPITGAFLGGFVLVFDNALLLQSRIMGLYPMLLFSLLLSLFGYLRFLKSPSWKWKGLCGISCGFAMGLQFTGVLALGLIFLGEGLRCLIQQSKIKDSLKFLASISLLALVVYLTGWYLHFELLPLKGPGDAFYVNSGSFWKDLWYLHGHMYRASATLTTPHPEASHWWTWPFMKIPIYYWKGNDASLYFVGNPVFWWGVTALFIHNLGDWLWKFFKQRDRGIFWIWLPLAGYIVGFAPLALMKRVLFLYHYLTPLIYSLIFVLAYISYRDWWAEGEKRKKLVIALCGFIVLGFLWLSPVTYGFSMPKFYWQSLPWKLWH